MRGLMLLVLSACGVGDPTYHQDVAPILDGRCVSCHQAGGIGPFALDSYAAAKPLASVIAASVKASSESNPTAESISATSLRSGPMCR